MKLEQQVCTLEQAKRLKELGVLQESLFCFDEYPFDPGNGFIRQRETEVYNFVGDLAMFTVAELGVMLPDNPGEPGEPEKGIWNWYHRKCWKGHSIGYTSYGKKTIEQGWFNTEAEARAAMLIHLLETKTITAEEVNKRLQA